MANFPNMKTMLLASWLAAAGSRPAMSQVPAQGQDMSQQPILRSLNDDSEPATKQGKWVRTIQSDLMAEKFAELDRMAAVYRRDRTRLAGGGWRLESFYGAMNPAMATEKDTADHLARLARWMQQRPESITARVADANSLIRWAWVARGNGSGRSVTPEGGRLFDERVEQARQVLEGAASMSPMDPQCFAEMLAVGMAQGWSVTKEKGVLDRGIKVEPEYYRLYKAYAYYLLPKWYGQPGQASKFATEYADAAGGEQGDIVYYEIAEELIRRHSNYPVKELDWTRIQRGWAALTARFGATKSLQNRLAYIAYEYRDGVVAQRQFTTIGEDWTKGVWGDRAFFEKARSWAQRHGGAQISEPLY